MQRPRCTLWNQLLLDPFWQERLNKGRAGSSRHWSDRLIDPGSEWRHRQWFDNSAMGDLLGEDVALVQKDKLYRCLDRLLPHKRDFFSMKERWNTLFNVSFDMSDQHLF